MNGDTKGYHMLKKVGSSDKGSGMLHRKNQPGYLRAAAGFISELCAYRNKTVLHQGGQMNGDTKGYQ